MVVGRCSRQFERAGPLAGLGQNRHKVSIEQADKWPGKSEKSRTVAPDNPQQNLAGWHSLECLQRGINRVPAMAAVCVSDHLRIELCRVVKAASMNGNQLRHCSECQIYRRSTGRAKGMDFFISAVACHPPGFCFAANRNGGPLGEGQIGSMPRATALLAIAALAVVLEYGLAARLIADRAARTSADIGLYHCQILSPSDLFLAPARDQADFGLAKMSTPRPVSRNDFRDERTTGQPCMTPFAILLPASSLSWVTVSRTILSYSTIAKVTRL